MKANEFVKKFGLDNAKRVLHGARGCSSVRLWGEYEFETNELKRLIDSHELVKSLKTKKNANREFTKACMQGQTERANMIKKALEDVEACQ